VWPPADCTDTSYPPHLDLMGVASVDLPQQAGIPCIFAALATLLQKLNWHPAIDKTVQRYAIEQRIKQLERFEREHWSGINPYPSTGDSFCSWLQSSPKAFSPNSSPNCGGYRRGAASCC
jgi:hypothetical protein